MRKLALATAVLVAFALTGVAQETGATGAKDKNKTAATANHKANKKATLTGCISAQPNGEGMYTISNNRYRKGVEVGPTDKVKDHAGHQVQLTGHWTTAAGAGEKETAGGGMKEESKERHFEVTDVKMISETCTTASGGATAGTKGKAKKQPKQ